MRTRTCANDEALLAVGFGRIENLRLFTEWSPPRRPRDEVLVLDPAHVHATTMASDKFAPAQYVSGLCVETPFLRSGCEIFVKNQLNTIELSLTISCVRCTEFWWMAALGVQRPIKKAIPSVCDCATQTARRSTSHWSLL